jgi:hypothetical protein
MYGIWKVKKAKIMRGPMVQFGFIDFNQAFYIIMRYISGSTVKV